MDGSDAGNYTLSQSDDGRHHRPGSDRIGHGVRQGLRRDDRGHRHLLSRTAAVAGDTVTDVDSAGTFADKNVGATKTVTATVALAGSRGQLLGASNSFHDRFHHC